MESPICFELSHDSSWDNDSRVADIRRCLSILSTLYANAKVQYVHSDTFLFRLCRVSRGMTTVKMDAVPQIILEDNLIRICLRHEKQIAIVSIADTIDVSILHTAIFYYLEYYTPTYQSLRDHQAKVIAKGIDLARKVKEEQGKVAVLQQRDIIEDDDILEGALNQLHEAEEHYKQNGSTLFEANQAIGRLFRFKQV